MSKLDDCLGKSQLARNIKGAVKASAQELSDAGGTSEADAGKRAVSKFLHAAESSRNAIAQALQPETVGAKAVTYKGRVFTGESHDDATRKLAAAFPNYKGSEPLQFGYVNGKGAFITKSQADAIKKGAMQGAMDAARPLMSASDPRLRKGEKQGDIFSGQQEDLTLMGETGTDWAAVQKAAEERELAKKEGQAKSDSEQGTLFASAQQPIPPEKMAAFVTIAQALLKQGIDTPEKLAKEIHANLGEKARPFSQALWDAMVLVRPELRGVHDWAALYAALDAPAPPPPDKPRKFRKTAPDGGFTEHPFIRAIMDDMGGILSKSAARAKWSPEKFAENASLWDGAPALADPRHNKIYNPRSGQTPDAIAAELTDMGLLADGDVNALWAELDKISGSSYRIEKQERDQAARDNQASLEQGPELEAELEPDPDWSVDQKEPSTPIARFENEFGVASEVHERKDGKFAVSLHDVDSGNQLPTLLIFDDKAIAIAKAKSLTGVDDGSSGIGLESDRGDSNAENQGGPGSLSPGSGATGGNGAVPPQSDGVAPNTGTSGPLPADLPPAPSGTGSDNGLREPASQPETSPPGDTGREGSGDNGELGTPPDTERTIIPGESLNLPPDSQGMGAVGDGRGSEVDDIARAAPALTPEQVEDVRFIEARLLEQNKSGVLLTNGTGTGKTFSGLGAIKRMLDRGAQHIIVVAPSDKIGSDWVQTAKDFFEISDVRQLADIKDNGKGSRVVVTTYANFGQNNSLVHRPWDAVVTDEAHSLSSNENGDDTNALDALRALTWHPDGIYHRVAMLEPAATQRMRELRQLERKQARYGKFTQAHQDEREKLQEQLDATSARVRAEQEAKSIGSRPKVIMLSATPFAYRKNIAYANGYLFDYPEVRGSGYNTPSPFGQFMMENFGYRMRTGKLTEPENATASGILERRFAERLMREKAMRGRALVVPFDYSREFVLTESQLGRKIDDIISYMNSTPRLRTLSKHIGVSDYLQRRFILEALKAREAVPRIRQHIALGRKVVVFHDYKLGGAANPLSPNFDQGAEVKYTSESGQNLSVRLETAFAELRDHFPDWDTTASELNGLRSPISYFTSEFAPEELGIFNGSVTKRERRRLVDSFNTSRGKMKVFLAQRASAKEGISLHDRDGVEQRAFIDLGIPGRPTDAIQSEGRTYRVGVKSNAVYEYLVTGTNFERWTFAQTIAQRASTAENLAMGEGARALLLSFSTGFNEAETFAPHPGQGTGGKEADEVRERGNPYQNAVALYYTNAKKTSRNKSQEGIDYFPTPEPLGFKMIEWAAIEPGEKFLEPSAGHGAIARFAPDATNRHAVEPSNELAGRLALNAPDTEIHEVRFEDFSIVNKFDTIVMNSPWGTAGKTAMEHLAKAAKHLKDGGRLVALIPAGPSMGKRFEDWYSSDEKPAGLFVRAQIVLPSVTFERAGTSISSRVVVLDKFHKDADANFAQEVHRNLDNGVSDIKELFARLEHLSVPSRPPRPVAVDPVTPADEPTDGKPPPKGYTYDPLADRKPLSPEASFVKPDKEGDFVPADFIHTKKNVQVWVAKTARYMSKDDFAAARVRAKDLGGYYSSFKGEGAIPGFHFKTAEARDKFIGGSGGEIFASAPVQVQEPDFIDEAAVSPEEKAQSDLLFASNPLKAIQALYKKDVEPIARDIGLTVKESLTMLQHLISPSTGVAMNAHDEVMRMLATRNQKAYETDRVLEGYRKMFEQMPRTQQVAFIDNMKLGKAQPTRELQQAAETMRRIDTETWEAARAAYSAIGFKNADIPLAWLENHFRVLWKVIPGGADTSAWIGRARRGLRGSMGQHKRHTLDTMSDGLAEGGVPYSYNPVVMFKLAQADLWKLTSTLKTWQWAKDNGLVQFIRGAFAKAPDGMVPLDDSIASVYFPADSGEGLVSAGKYFVEEGFGRLLNNYLSKDLIRQTKAGRGLLWIKNATTALELSLSVFHGVFETMEMVGSNVGLGLSQLYNRGILKGDLGAAAQGIKTMMSAPASPVTGFLLGKEIRKAAGDPSAYFKTAAGKKMLASYPRAREFIDDLFVAGWKPTELEQDWKNNSVRTFVEAVSDLKAGASDNYIGAGLRAFPAANEMLMKPLFEHFIPNLKVAQFFKEYAEALENNKVLTRAALARQVWRFVEDRFGELNYDTLFWNANFKTAMQLMFRSVTWKLGSVEAFAGAVGGQGKEFVNAFNERRAPELHRNAAWLFGMLLLTATLGAIISKVLAGKNPKNLTDLVFPQIDPKDDKVRVSLPTYFKDLVHLIHAPTSYITSSMSGWIGRVMDLLRNKDYYGTQIRDTDAPATKQALQFGKYAGETLLPFSIRGYKNLSAQDVGGLRKSLAIVGINPAPRFISQSEAEKVSENYWKGRQTEAGVKPEQFEASSEKRKLVNQIRHGEAPNVSSALSSGLIKPKDVKALYKRAGMGALASQIDHMPLIDAERVYQSATLAERAKLEPIMVRKRKGSLKAGRTMFQGF